MITTPSIGMLIAMATTSLGDDVFREDEVTMSFEREVASLCGQEAGAFVISGTMANQLSLRTLLSVPPYAIMADARAHILHYEGAGVGVMTGAHVQTVQPSNGKYLRVEDIKANAILTDDVHKCPTRVISLENTAAGSVVPVAELARISHWAHDNGILIHMDGARLFEAIATGAGSLYDYGSLCDLVTVDFSKNLGAPMGAMVVGSSAMIHQLRRIRKSIGGGMRQCGPVVAAAQYAFHEQFGQGPWGDPVKLRATHEMAKRVGRMWTQQGGGLLLDVETNQVWVDLKRAGISDQRWIEMGRKYGIKLDGKRIVFHHQTSEDAVARLGLVFQEVLGQKIQARL